MLARSAGLAAALLVVVPSLVLAQDPSLGSDANPTPHKLGKTTLPGKVTVRDGKVTVNNVRIERGALSALLSTLDGKFVTLKGTIAQGTPQDTMKAAAIRRTNGGTKKVDVLQGPDMAARALTQVDPGRGIDVIGLSRDGQWLKVSILEDGDTTEVGWVKGGELKLAGDTLEGANPKRQVTGPVVVDKDGVTVNGVRVKNEDFAKILEAAKGLTVTVEGFVTKSDAGDRIQVTAILAPSTAQRARDIKVLQSPAPNAPQLGAPIPAKQPVAITGITPDGAYYTTIVAEGDMRETGYVKVSDVSLGVPSDTKGVTGALRAP